MADTARRVLGLERVLLLPAGCPPHKDARRLSPFPDRLEMARIAARDLEAVEASDLDAAGDGPSYTVDLLARCRDRFGSSLYFIVGADSLRDLPRWHRPRRILELCTLVVFPRDDIPMRLAVPGEASLVLFEAPRVDVSSSGLRRAIREGVDVSDRIPDGVMEYVRRRGLYGGAP